MSKKGFRTVAPVVGMSVSVMPGGYEHLYRQAIVKNEVEKMTPPEERGIAPMPSEAEVDSFVEQLLAMDDGVSGAALVGTMVRKDMVVTDPGAVGTADLGLETEPQASPDGE